MDSHHLPPSHACLQKHILRANYQSKIWRSCLSTLAEYPSPNGNGWKLSENQNILIDWTSENAASDSVLELRSCSCKQLCDRTQCTCIVNFLKCTDMCKCSCETGSENDDETEGDGTGDSEDDDEDSDSEDSCE